MSGADQRLPPGFEALDPYVDTWALETADQRAKQRLVTPEAERTAFYEAAKPLLTKALGFLDGKPIGQFDEREARLMDLMLSLAHVSLAVEVQRANEAKHAQGAKHITIVRSAAAAP